jgi:hypothetical protein
MRKTNFLLSTAVTCLIANVASQAAVTTKTMSRSAVSTAPGLSFIIAPYVVGGQPLFTSTIVSVNLSALSLTTGLSGNNVSPAPQGGIGVAQGGLGAGSRNTFSTSNSMGVGRSLGGVTTGSTSSSSTTSGTSSQGFSSANNTTGLSSAGFTSANNTTGLSSAGTTSMNNSTGTSSAGFSSANNTTGSSSVGQNSSNSVTNPTSGQIAGNGNATATPVLLLTSLISSTNPKFGSAGALFQGVSNTPISTISFQFGQLANLSGVTTPTNLAPMLVIDDGANGLLVNTRFIPVTAGTLHNDGGGLTTVTFNSSQLNISGLAQNVGVAFSQQGSIVVDNVQVNGTPSTGIVALSTSTFPF